MSISDWYWQNLRRLFFDMHLPDWTRPGQSAGEQCDLRGVASRFDPEQLVATFVRARINVAVIFAKCQYGNFYYNTKIGHKHTGLADLDFLGDMVSLAHRHGIRVIAYYSNMWDTEAAREHPEWMAEEADGSYSYERWPTMSLLSPYRERVHDHLREIVSHYEVDGIWSDILSDLPSFDRYTKARFEAECRQTMPRSNQDPGWLQFVRWQQDMLYEYIKSCRDLVRSIRPEAAYIINFFGTPYALASQGLSFKHLDLSDMGSTEGYTEWHGLMFPSYAARYIRAGVRSRPFEVLTGRFIHTWDFTLRSQAQMRYEAFSVVANGGAVCIDDEPYQDGTIELDVYDSIENIYTEIEQREATLIGTEPVRYAALYVSQKVRELDEVLNRAKKPTGSLTPESNLNPSDADMLASWMGAFKALTEAHIPVQIIDDRAESLTQLPQYRVVFLPNIMTLSEHEAAALRAYVAAGGGLIATGATSLYDDEGRQLSNFQLADLFGVDFVARGQLTFPYFQFHSSDFTQDFIRRPLPHYMAMWEVRVNQPDVKVAATRRDPLIETRGETYYHNNQPPPGEDTGEPVIVYRNFGHGRVIYCAALPASNYARLGHEPYRRLIANMISWAAGSRPPVRTEGFLNTEIVVNHLGDDLIIHLVTGIPQRAVRFGLGRTVDSIEEQAQLGPLTLEIPQETTEVFRKPHGEPVAIVRDGSRTTITLASIGDWETLQLKGNFKTGGISG